MRGCHVDIRGHLRDDALGVQFVLAVGVGVQKADGDGGAAIVHELLGAGSHLPLVQGGEHLAVVKRALLYAEAPIAGDQGLVRLDEDVEHGAAQVLDAAPHLDQIAEALGGDHADFGAALGDQDVGAQRGAVDDLLHLAKKLLEGLPVVAGGLAHRREEALRRIVGRR